MNLHWYDSHKTRWYVHIFHRSPALRKGYFEMCTYQPCVCVCIKLCTHMSNYLYIRIWLYIITYYTHLHVTIYAHTGMCVFIHTMLTWKLYILSFGSILHIFNMITGRKTHSKIICTHINVHKYSHRFVLIIYVRIFVLICIYIRIPWLTIFISG